MRTTRRAFLGGFMAGALAYGRTSTADTSAIDLGLPHPERLLRGDSSVGAVLRMGGRVDLGEDRVPRSFDDRARSRQFDLSSRFRDLPRHFVFEYYPWYRTNPFGHWNEADRVPPHDIASNYMPALGPYDSRSRAVIEQHARWIVESGAGAVNLSWWGRDSFPDRAVHGVMDVMRDHGIHVTFHLEPYANDRADRYVTDIVYLLREYGEKRRWDCLLLLENATGESGPVFKSFRTIVPRSGRDCHGVTHVVRDYTADERWRRQTDLARETLRKDFDHITLLADSLDYSRTRAGGFDGIAVYDNYVRPERWGGIALRADEHGLLFSFNINPGFDGIVRRRVSPNSCYRPPRFEPGSAEPRWDHPNGRDLARQLSEERIDESASRTIGLQNHPALTNFRRGFFLVYVNSFNEWHEGHQFEPMRHFADLSDAERPFGYHNADAGDYRLRYLRARLDALVH
jgi:hypothetical protein